MKKMFGMVALVLAVVFVSSGVVDINAAESDVSLVHVVQPGETLYRIGRVHGVAWTVLAEYNGLDNPNLIFPGQRVRMPGVEREWTLKELGEIIVSAGLFWEDFFWIRGIFEYKHHDNSARLQGNHPQHLESWTALSPTSGFTNVNDVRAFLLQYYTEAWIDSLLYGDYPPFVDYKSVLYMRAGVSGPSSEARPDWTTSTHKMVEQANNIIIIETTVLFGTWDWFLFENDVYSFKTTKRFKLINGRIDCGPDAWSIRVYRYI